MKSEMLEVLNSIAIMGQILQMVMSALQLNSCPRPQGLHTSQLVSPAPKGWTIRIQGLQAIVVSCAMKELIS